MVMTAIEGGLFGTDFFPVWASAHNLLHHRPIYSGELAAFTFSFYPPSAAVLTAPLGLLGVNVAAKVFCVGQAGALLYSMWLFTRRFCGARAGPVFVGSMVGCAIALPFEYALEFGNVNVLLLALVLIFFVGAADDRRWTGAVLGVSLALKPIVWPLLILLLLRRQNRQTFIAFATVIGLVILGVAVSRDGLSFFTDVLPYVLRGEPDLVRYNVSILGVAGLAGVPAVVGVLGRLVVVAGAVAVSARLARRSPSDLDLIEGGIALLLASFAFGSWTLFYYAVFALPPLMLVLDRRAAACNPVMWLFVYAAGASFDIGGQTARNARYLLCIIALAAMLGGAVWRRREASAITPSALGGCPTGSRPGLRTRAS